MWSLLINGHHRNVVSPNQSDRGVVNYDQAEPFPGLAMRRTTERFKAKQFRGTRSRKIAHWILQRRDCQLSAERLRCQRLPAYDHCSSCRAAPPIAPKSAVSSDANRSRRAPSQPFHRQAREKFLQASSQAFCESYPHDRRAGGFPCLDNYRKEHHWFTHMPRAYARAREMHRANWLDKPVRVSQNSASLNGSESGAEFSAGSSSLPDPQCREVFQREKKEEL